MVTPTGLPILIGCGVTVGQSWGVWSQIATSARQPPTRDSRLLPTVQVMAGKAAEAELELELLSTVWEIPQVPTSGTARRRRLPGTWAVNGDTTVYGGWGTRSLLTSSLAGNFWLAKARALW